MGNKILIFSFIFFTTSLVTCFFMLKLNNVTNNEGVQIMTGNIIMNKENQDDKGIENKTIKNDDEILDEKDKERLENNAKILTQIQNEDFWNKKIEQTIDKAIWGEKGDIKIVGYGLLCEQYNENLEDCNYRVSFSNEVDRGGRTGFEVYSNSSSTSSRRGFSYHLAAKEIAMNDIGNGGIFYDVSNWNDDELKIKYLGKDFESTYDGDYRFIEVVEFVTNNEDGTSNHHLYIIADENGEILYKDSKTIISRDAAKLIIANDAGINKSNVKFLYFRSGSGIYECSFSYSGHTYDYEITAKDGKIIKGIDEIDIGEEAAMEIATSDAGIDGDDLMLEVDNGHMFTYLMPHTEKIGTGNSAIYKVSITTNKDKHYLYDISAIDGKILSSKFGENFVINDKIGSSNNLTFKIESAFPKKQKLDVKIHELKMDNIYEFKDLIYLWLELEGGEIIDWSLIDKSSDKNLGKMTKKELDELYNFESHYKVEDMGIFTGEIINLSGLKENIIYKYSLPKGDYSDIEIINDLGEDIIVYENMATPYNKDRAIKYTANPYLKDGYTRGSRAYYYHDGKEVLYVMYKKVSTEDLLKIIDESEITFLSKYKIGDTISEKDRSYDENYLYNDTNDSLTVLITNEIGSKVETMEVIIKPGKIVHCSEYADSVSILK